jgi:hypothetical protein
VQTFPTFCSAEGDTEALKRSSPRSRKLARVFDIAPELKPVYHSGGCRVQLPGRLIEALRAQRRWHSTLGVAQALEPMVRETVDAIFDKGPKALTNRSRVVTWRRSDASTPWSGIGTAMGELYRGLGQQPALADRPAPRRETRGGTRKRSKVTRVVQSIHDSPITIHAFHAIEDSFRKARRSPQRARCGHQPGRAENVDREAFDDGWEKPAVEPPLRRMSRRSACEHHHADSP